MLFLIDLGRLKDIVYECRIVNIGYSLIMVNVGGRNLGDNQEAEGASVPKLGQTVMTDVTKGQIDGAEDHQEHGIISDGAQETILGYEEIAATGAYQELSTPHMNLWSRINRFIRKKAVYRSAGIILVIFLLTAIPIIVYTWDHHLMVKGVTISGLNVANLTQDQAKSTIDQEVMRLGGQTLKLKVGQETPEVTLQDLGLSINAESALKSAYDLGRTGTIFTKLQNKLSASYGINFELALNWDDQKLKEVLTRTLAAYSDPAQDATFEISDQNIMVIKAEHGGFTFDYEGLASKIKEISINKPDLAIQVEFQKQTPSITAAQLEEQKITGLLGTYTTVFNASLIERTSNVRTAANALDMKVIKPGEILSFNQLVGERTVAGGYKDAFIILDGKFVPGLGGGICQVSSTLYNAGLLANLSVNERSNHDLAITYTPLGQDATVAFPDLDLKFLNDSGGYLLIRTKTSYNTLTIELYGKVVPGREVYISNATQSVIPAVEQHLVDETMAHGESNVTQHGQPGYVVNAYRTVKENGQVVKTETLNQSRYAPLPTIVAVGP